MSSEVSPIPQCDLRAAYERDRNEILGVVGRVLESGWYILGEEVRAFEEAFARYIGARYAVAVASGTDAVELALRVCGVQRGDLVCTVSHTAVATVAAIEASGGVPFLLDVSPETMCMDPDALSKAVGAMRGKVKAVVPVHLYGQPADMDAILEIASRNGLSVVEDCAQAHGATYKGRKVGGLGAAGAFSFYPTKNLGAMGDGGAVVTDEEAVADRLRLFRQYGWRERFISEIPGSNSRLDALQAAILRARLNHLDTRNQRRNHLATLYSRLLEDCQLRLPGCRPGCGHVFHQYVVRLPLRDHLRQYLRSQGIETAIHYPRPVHLQPAYTGRVLTQDELPVTSRLVNEILSLPMYPELSDEDVARVCDNVRLWSRTFGLERR